MVQLKKYDLSGNEVEQVELKDDLLDCEANPQMVKDYVVALRANLRQWSANTKDKSEVNHGGAKPHPQKGTGKARQGTLASPQYKGGGVVFGPKPKFNQHVRINQKERNKAVRSLLTTLIKDEKMHILKYDALKEPKTKTFAEFLKKVGLDNKKVLFLTEYEYPESYLPMAKSLRNIKKAKFLNLKNINGYEMLKSQHVILLEPALEQLTTLLGRSA
ncbi:MAG: 50S ribosomal protein L4 [Chlamydiia bacterium]|nr:50S ribosomal protein L4 [Chlamydiia bacterium]